MSLQIVSPVNYNQNEIQNARIQNLASDPSSPVPGQIWFNSSANTLKLYDGSGNRVIAELNNRLDQFAAPASALSMSGQTISNLGNPSATTDAATKGYVDSVALGLDVKPSVRAASTGNITIASLVAGNVIDGVTLVSGDRILAKNQTTASENGIYITPSSAGNASRSADLNSSANYVSGAFTFVEQGTVNQGSSWIVSTQGTITPGTTSVSWNQFGGGASYSAGTGLTLSGGAFSVNADGATVEIAANNLRVKSSSTAGQVLTSGGTGNPASWSNALKKFTATIGDGSATSIVVNHALGTKDVLVQVQSLTAPYPQVLVEIDYTDANNVTLVFATAPASNSYRVVING